ncbi:MAG: flagellar hook capping FlgD N-terminal domain-containing protein [Pseudomonadota bacterium]
MDVTTQNALNSAPLPTAEPPTPESASDALTSDFETFLRMLTTQMENQDPLNPIESSDFAVQLATFSGVEQQIRTNDLLESLGTGLGASGLGQLAGWVGMEARVSAPASFTGAPLTLAPEADSGADGAFLVVKSASGQVVSREALPLDAETVVWAGVGDSGTPLPDGTYTFEVESLSRGEVMSTKPVDHYALINEARLSDDGVNVVLSGGAIVPSSEVKALRSPVNNTL